jgi:hypothetical protein
MDAEEYQRVANKLRSYRRRLQKLEQQAAIFGNQTPPHVLIEIEDLQEKITRSEAELVRTHPPRRSNRLSSTVDQETKSTRRLRIFLCYTSIDRPAVRKLYQRLRDEGFEPWLNEENILPGQDWEHEIRKAVQETDVVIICLSSESISTAGYIHKEIRMVLSVAEEKPEGNILVLQDLPETALDVVARHGLKRR